MKHKIYVISVYTVYRLVAVLPAHMTSSTTSYEEWLCIISVLSQPIGIYMYIAFLTAECCRFDLFMPDYKEHVEKRKKKNFSTKCTRGNEKMYEKGTVKQKNINWRRSLITFFFVVVHVEA